MDRQDRLRHWDDAPRPVITPSLLDCDFARMGDELDALVGAGVVAAHLDVMDGHFVPNLSYGPPVIDDWRPRVDLAFDAHLMIADPARYLDAFIKAGCDSILFHVEVVPEPSALAATIRAAGCRAGLVLNPPTPVEAALPYLDRLDTVLVMSVMPGFGGQAFQAGVLEKVRALRKARPDLNVAIDGGINAGTAARAVDAGCTQLVVGSATWRPDRDIAGALGAVAVAARGGLLGGATPADPAGPSPPP